MRRRVAIACVTMIAASALATAPRGPGDTMAGSPWKPFPFWGGGFIQNAMFVPGSPSVLYAYADVSGPWRSDDAGREWYPLAQNFTLTQASRRAYQVRGMSVDPRNADSFVLAGGSNNSKSYSAGIYVSRDGGRTFRQTGMARFHAQGPNLRPYGQVIARNPFDPDELIAGEDTDGLYMSRDNGETWRCVGNGLEKYWFTDMRWDMAASNRIYACAPPRKDGDESGFFRSDDDGRTWRRLSGKSPLELFQIAGDARVVAAFGGADVRMSTDGCETWSGFSQGLRPPAGPVKSVGAQGNYHACAAGRDFWLLGDGDGNIYRRGRDDPEWTPVKAESFLPGCPAEEAYLVTRDPWGRRVLGHGLRPEHLTSLAVDPRDAGHWLAIDWYVIWETRDAGAHWKSAVKGLAPTVPFTVACDPFDADGIVAGYADMGLHVSRDGGKTFKMPSFGYWCSCVAWSRTVKDLALATGGKQDITFSRTLDGGRTWKLLPATGLPKMHTFAHAAFTVAAHPARDEFLVAVSGPVGPGKGGIYRSLDHGDTWQWFGEGLPEGAKLFKEGEFDAGYDPEIVISPNGDMVARAPKAGKAYWRADGGTAWTECAGVRDARRQVAADPFRPGRFLMSDPARPLESLDGGRTFRECRHISGNWLQMAFDAHVKGLFVAAEYDRMLISRDGGLTFMVLDDRFVLPAGAVRRFDLDRGRLFFRTDGNGIFMRKIATD